VTLQKLYQIYRGQIDFYWIYSQEARASDTGLGGSKDPSPLAKVKNHRTSAERQTAAKRCATAISCTIPQLIDDLDQSITIRYHGHPTRLYIIGKDNHIAYSGKPGPFKTDLKAFGEALRKQGEQK